MLGNGFCLIHFYAKLRIFWVILRSSIYGRIQLFIWTDKKCSLISPSFWEHSCYIIKWLQRQLEFRPFSGNCYFFILLSSNIVTFNKSQKYQQKYPPEVLYKNFSIFFFFFKFIAIFAGKRVHGCFPMNIAKLLLNTFSTNVPLTDKPGSWFLLAKCSKNTFARVRFQVKMQVRPASLLKMSLFHRCLIHLFWSIFANNCLCTNSTRIIIFRMMQVQI